MQGGVVYIVAGLVAAGWLCGCASPGVYFADRGRDAADIVSLSVGEGYGAKARVSALSFGLLYGGSVAGLRLAEDAAFVQALRASRFL